MNHYKLSLMDKAQVRGSGRCGKFVLFILIGSLFMVSYLCVISINESTALQKEYEKLKIKHEEHLEDLTASEEYNKKLDSELKKSAAKILSYKEKEIKYSECERLHRQCQNDLKEERKLVDELQERDDAFQVEVSHLKEDNTKLKEDLSRFNFLQEEVADLEKVMNSLQEEKKALLQYKTDQEAAIKVKNEEDTANNNIPQDAVADSKDAVSETSDHVVESGKVEFNPQTDNNIMDPSTIIRNKSLPSDPSISNDLGSQTDSAVKNPLAAEAVDTLVDKEEKEVGVVDQEQKSSSPVVSPPDEEEPAVSEVEKEEN